MRRRRLATRRFRDAQSRSDALFFAGVVVAVVVLAVAQSRVLPEYVLNSPIDQLLNALNLIALIAGISCYRRRGRVAVWIVLAMAFLSTFVVYAVVCEWHSKSAAPGGRVMAA